MTAVRVQNVAIYYSQGRQSNPQKITTGNLQFFN